MQEPDEVEALSIPTPLDVAMSISRRFADEAAAGGLSDDLAEGLAQALAGEQHSDIGLLLLITYARGCHEAAEVFCCNGKDSLASLMHAMGQDLLGKAMDTYGELVAIGIAASGTTRH